MVFLCRSSAVASQRISSRFQERKVSVFAERDVSELIIRTLGTTHRLSHAPCLRLGIRAFANAIQLVMLSYQETH